MSGIQVATKQTVVNENKIEWRARVRSSACILVGEQMVNVGVRELYFCFWKLKLINSRQINKRKGKQISFNVIVYMCVCMYIYMGAMENMNLKRNQMVKA